MDIKMKVRNGFVSNSSSSSFVLMTSVENHKRAMKQLDETEQKIVNAMMTTGGSLFGKQIMVGEELSTGDWYTLGEVARQLELDDSNDEVYETWEKYQSLLKENKDEVFSYSMDF